MNRPAWIALVCCVCIITMFAWAQTRKPALWALTSTTTWQQSPYPAGMGGSPPGGGARTTDVCFTQEQIDKYGAIIPPMSGGCRLTSLVKKAKGMTANMVCTGRMSGQANMESSWTDDRHATGKMHFVGSIAVGPNTKPMEWTTATSSVYKGADCGSVKPYPLVPVK